MIKFDRKILLVPDNRNTSAEMGVAQWCRGDFGDGVHARHGPNTFQQLPLKNCGASLVVARSGKVERSGSDVLHLETWIHRLGPVQRAQQQPGSKHQDRANGCLDSHQPAAEESSLTSPGLGVGSLVFEG